MNDDSVYGLGFNKCGCLGLGHNNRVNDHQLIPGLSGLSIEEFFWFSHGVFGRTSKNHIYSWGFNDFLGRNELDSSSFFQKPCRIKDLKDIIFITNGFAHYMALSCHGDIFGWGENKLGEVDYNCEKEFIDIPIRIKLNCDNEKVKYLYCQLHHTAVITNKGQCYIWGGDDGQKFSNSPIRLDLSSPDIISIDISDHEQIEPRSFILSGSKLTIFKDLDYKNIYLV